MSKEKAAPLMPFLQRLFNSLGENIRLARLRRGFSAMVVAERADISRNTLRSIEHGDPSVAFGAYARVLLCLNLEKDLGLLASDDELGRKLQDAALSLRARAPKVGKKSS